DILIRLTIHNRGREPAPLHVLPQLVCRNTWSWRANAVKPRMYLEDERVIIEHPELGTYYLHCETAPTWLFTENETNFNRLFGTQFGGHFKDAFHDYLVHGRLDVVNPVHRGTKAAALHHFDIPGGGSVQLRLRLTRRVLQQPFADHEEMFAERLRDADAFYASIQHEIPDPDARLVQRQAFAGMIWSKQFFYLNVEEWLHGDPTQLPPPSERRRGRNRDWTHLNNSDVISMPDKWEYPWYAAWDLAFHTVALVIIDPQFAKEQLRLLTREWYMHPNGQMPAYEWAFGDVNPPVHAWATWRVFQIDRKQRGDHGDLMFLESVFHKLMLNFTWWVNRKDAEGRNIFQGGFLGLDNIGVFDRSATLPTGGHIDQADGTSWMAMYALNLMRIALELAQHNAVYEDIATKFFEHFLHIAEAMNNMGEAGIGLWDDTDKFFYDVLHLPDGGLVPMKVRSMVGLIPMFAVETLEPDLLDKLPGFKRRMEWLLSNRPELAALVSHWDEPGLGKRRLLSLLRGHRMKRLLKRMLDETEFLSDFGVRAISKHHEGNPYHFVSHGLDLAVRYLPAESDSGLFGGNSNWRGPIWFPVNYLLIESLQKFHHYYGNDFRIECPTGSGHFTTLNQAAEEIARRLRNLFLKDAHGRRAVFGNYEQLQQDPHFRDYVLFYEYFHGDSGRGVGASHQTGWTGLIAKLLQPRHE
ncbi:MAG: glucosidase, partial [Gammaproteobacteria bacterium]|nr:glucosidase [Gammaproteobacteria bacterium]